MKKSFNPIWIIAGIVLLIVLMAWSGYNGMVKAERAADAQWANVENVYQRRADLIPNLVNTVKGYAEHERETLEEVVNARSKATGINISADNLDAASLQKFQAAQDGLSNALSKLLMVVERYPDLKANQNFLDLQAQLEGSENRIAVERRKFNDIVRDYNTRIKRFPGVLFNKFYGFEQKDYFEAREGAEIAPEVNF